MIGAVVGLLIGAGAVFASIAKAKSGDNKGAVQAGMKPIKNNQMKKSSKMRKALTDTYDDAELSDIDEIAAIRKETKDNLEHASMTNQEKRWAVKAAAKDAKGKTAKADKYREKIMKSQVGDVESKGDFPSAPQGEMMA